MRLLPSYTDWREQLRDAGSEDKLAPTDVFWDESVDRGDSGILEELLDTGSVTVQFGGKQYVVSLQVEEAGGVPTILPDELG